MAMIQGPKGQRVITAEQIAAMSVTDQANITIEIQDALNRDPGLRAKITDTPAGGLLVKWWHA